MKDKLIHNTNIKKMVLSAVCLSVGMVLPFLTGQVKEIGDSLLPMHFVVMLCGLLCGGKYGFFVGAILPVLRAVTLGMPPLYPNSVWMSAELATYGLVIGFLYFNFCKRQLWWLYCCMLISMVSGRIIWGITKAILLGVSGKGFTLQAFIMGALIDSLPGIILQLVFLPILISLINMFSERACKH